MTHMTDKGYLTPEEQAKVKAERQAIQETQEPVLAVKPVIKKDK